MCYPTIESFDCELNYINTSNNNVKLLMLNLFLTINFSIALLITAALKLQNYYLIL